MTVQYTGKNSDQGPSPSIWTHIDIAHIKEDPNFGTFFFDHFLNFGQNTENDVTATYHSQIDSGGTIKQTGAVDGRIQFLTDAGSDDGIVMGIGADIGGALTIVENSGRKVAFEGRVLFSEAVTGQAFFLGLIEKGEIVADTILTDSTGALPDKDYLGFRVLAADPDGIDAVHRGGDTAEVIVENEAQVITIATNYKLGLYFNGRKTVNFYVDGTVVGSAQTDDTDFPDGIVLVPVVAFKETSGSAEYIEMDWWSWVYEAA